MYLHKKVFIVFNFYKCKLQEKYEIEISFRDKK